MKVSKQERKMFSRCKWCTTCDKDSLTNQTLLRLPWTLFQLWLTSRFCYPSLHCLTLAWTLLSQFNQKVPPLNICWGFSSSTTPLGTSGHPCLPSVRILSGWFGQNHPPFPTPPTSNASLSLSHSPSNEHSLAPWPSIPMCPLTSISISLPMETTEVVLHLLP